MLRSLVFTLLLEEREFGRLTTDDGSRIVTDAVERVEQDQAKDPGLTVAKAMAQYIDDVTNRHTCEPGIWQRYVNVLKAGDERGEGPDRTKPVSVPPHFLARCAVCGRQVNTEREPLYPGATPWTYTDREHSLLEAQ